jgi:hypothetical protein
MKQNIRHSIVRHDEPITLGCIEPLYLPGNDDNIDTGLFGRLTER